jgi:hypothetical protein
MRIRFAPLFAVGALAVSVACAPQVATPGAPALSEADASARITPEAMRERIGALAHDTMRGRDTPSPELDQAAEWIADHWRRLGLEPGGEDGTYFQRYPFLQTGLQADGIQLGLVTPAGDHSLRYGRDFFVQGRTDQAFDAARLLYVGDPTAVPAGTLRDQLVVVKTPGQWGRDFRILAGQQARAAHDAGAIGTLHIVEEAWTEEMMERYAGFFTQPGWGLEETASPAFPQFFLSRRAAGELFAAADLDLDDVLASARAGELVDLPLPGVTALGAAPRVELQRAYPPNIAGVVRGSDPELRDEYIVLSAHIDHVGVGTPDERGDSIYNGADDNASGSAALLAIGEALMSMRERPRRSIMLLHVSGEEKGLLGSRWFVDNPTVPIERIVANINMDMIAGDAHTDSVVVIGKDYSDMGPLVDGINARMPELNLTTSDDLWPEQRFFYRSDQFNFMRKEIPSLFFFTGVHECYHRPCDTVDFVDHSKAARVTRLALHSVIELANRDARPEWRPEGLAEVRELTR